MQVSLKYAQEHLSDLAIAASNGEEVEISLPGQLTLVVLQRRDPVPFKRPTARILGEGAGEMVVPEWDDWKVIDQHGEQNASELAMEATPERPRAELFGSLRGKIELADDWDSFETNEEIEDLFENSEIFPNGKLR